MRRTARTLRRLRAVSGHLALQGLLRTLRWLSRPSRRCHRLTPLVLLSVTMCIAMQGMLVSFPTPRHPHLAHFRFAVSARNRTANATAPDFPLWVAIPRRHKPNATARGHTMPRPHVKLKPAKPFTRSDAVLCGGLGVVAALTFSALGAAYGIAKAGVGVVHMCRLSPASTPRGLLPVVMAELLAVYAFVYSLAVIHAWTPDAYTPFAGFLHLAGGLIVGLSGLASGLSIGIIGDASVRVYSRQLRRHEDACRAPRPQPLASPCSPSSPSTSFSSPRKSGRQPTTADATAAAADLKVAARRTFAAMMLMLIFAEGIGLYGLIAGFLLHSVAMSGLSTAPIPAEAFPRTLVVYAQPSSCGLFGALGATFAVGFATMGAAFGIARTSGAVCHLGILQPPRLLRGTAPVVMAELLAIYGFVLALALVLGLDIRSYSPFAGYLDFAAGCAVGLGCLAAGWAIGIVGDAGVRAYAKQVRVFATLVLTLVFAEALGLGSLIVGLVLHSTATESLCTPL